MLMLLTGKVNENELSAYRNRYYQKKRETAMNNMLIQSGRVAFSLRIAAMLLFSGIFLSGCATSGTGVAGAKSNELSSSLAGTEWRLVEFRSMDDAQGISRPHDRSLYTMRLNADGSVNMRLNCNRANGSWKAESGINPLSGTFTFGPLAATKARCLPPSMDLLILRQAGYIRSYMLKDGRLFLSLMADGGILVWEPPGGDSRL
ncbi:MAG: META domain-containing protein [Chlorobiaceae bacterium]|nr:META domain-containing protein [Chlorobiaceae bacterium]